MIKQYYKQALAQLRQHPLISIIGIVGTALSIFLIMLVVMMQQVKVAPFSPESNRNRFLHVHYMSISHKDWGNGTSNGPMSVQTAREVYKSLKTPEAVTVYCCMTVSTPVSLPGAPAIGADVRETDDTFFHVFDFQFTDGKPYDEATFTAGRPVAVITESISRALFGSIQSVGKEFLLSHAPYRVVGVVKDVSTLADMAYGQVWIPFTSTNLSNDTWSDNHMGMMSVTLLAHDREDFDEIRKDEMERFGKESVLEQMMKRASDRMLTNRLDSLMGNTVPRPALTKMDLERLDLDKIADYYCSLYSNPSQMTFVVTGKFDTDSIKELLTATFGRMPKVNTVSYPNKAFKLPKKTYIEEFPNDNDTQTIFDYVFCGNYQPSLKNSLTLKLMRDILQNRLLSVLREGENIVYSPYASLFYNGLPQQVFYFDLSASVDFVNTKKVEELIKQIINELRTSKVSEEELETLKKSFWVTKRKVLSDEASAEWRTNLVNLLKNGESVADFERYEQCLDSISTVDIQKAFKHFTNPDKFVLLYIGKHQKYE